MNSNKVYYSVGLNENLPNKRIAGKIIIGKDSLDFIYDNEFIRMNFKSLNIRIGGSGNNLIFFSHPDLSGWDIYTSDKSILRNPIIKQDPAFNSVRNENNRSLLKLSLVLIGISLFITGIIYSFKAIKDSMSYAVAAQLPISFEKSIGDAAFKSYIAGKTITNDPMIIEKLKPITERLLEQTKNSGYEFKFHIVKDNHINAIAFPGGNILIHSGLIEQAEVPEEIAGVLAHEISHITLKHGIRHIINTVGLFIVVQGFIGDFSGIIAVITQNSSIFLSSRFSRDFEKEADAKGYKYLIQSNINPKGLTKFFEKILEIEKEEGIAENEIIRFISTHPDTKERIEKINEMAKDSKDEDFTPIKMDLLTLQRQIKLKLN